MPPRTNPSGERSSSHTLSVNSSQAGRGRAVPLVVPTQFVMAGDDLLVHLIRRNPLFDAVRENARVVSSVAGDSALIPSSWKAIGDEYPRRRHTHHVLRRRSTGGRGRDRRSTRRRRLGPALPARPGCNPPRMSSILRSTAPVCRRSAAYGCRSPTCGPSSSTGATSIGPIATLFWSTCNNETGPATGRRRPPPRRDQPTWDALKGS